MSVFVLDTNKTPLAPCHEAKARRLLDEGRAAIWKRYPFTIILKYAVESPAVPELRVKLDPGSKTTGIAVVDDSTGKVVFAAELTHCGQSITSDLDDRRGVRRGRRNRHTRYRKPRWQNRRRPSGWLPPSLQSRISNVMTWVSRLMRVCHITTISQELVRFDMQAMENAEISGVEYQQGTLAGYEVREYLLEKWKRACTYCGKENIALQIEHIVPRAKGGSNRISNLCLACEKCNQAKGTKDVRDFLKKKPELLKKILAQAKAPLKDAAAVNATRWELYRWLESLGLPIECGSGGLTKYGSGSKPKDAASKETTSQQTSNESHHSQMTHHPKYNRTTRELPKAHWLDAACVGKSTPEVLKTKGVRPLSLTANGHGCRQMCLSDKYGFPRTSAKGSKFVKGFQTGDIVKAKVTSGKKVGTYVGRVAVRATGSFNITTEQGTVQGISYKYCQAVHKMDGYSYQGELCASWHTPSSRPHPNYESEEGLFPPHALCWQGFPEADV